MKVVIVSAMWCPSCLVMKPHFQELTNKYPDIEVNILDIDFDIEVKNYDVGKILPVLMIIKDDQEIERLVGEKNKQEIFQIVEKYLGE